MSKRIAVLGLILAAAMVLAACGPEASPTSAPPRSVTTEGAPVVVATEMPQTLPTEAPVDVPVEPTEPPMVVVTPRSEMEATNPGSVNLASGTPTLVEFFAFW
ncbi:MAG: hypothetical protein D6770_07860 [Anaerolineae bacterium]|nr:MAG: hypothetical protein D6770_07860 [Anaerolineae bacterium]